MAKIAKTELNRILSCLPSETEISLKLGDETFNFCVKKFITAEESAAFVDAVIDSIQSEGKFYYGLFDLAFRLQVISTFTNIPVPEKPVVRENLAYSPIFDEVKNNLAEQLCELQKACEYKLAADEHMSRILFEAAVKPDPLNKLVGIIENAIDSIKDGVTKQDLLPVFSNLIKSNLGEIEEGDMIESKNQV